MRARWRSAGGWVTFALCTLACVGGAVLAAWFATLNWQVLSHYQSAFAQHPAPEELVSVEPTPAAPLASRVVLVIVEGLREDAVQPSMPTLSRLTNYGANMTLSMPQPSETLPSFATLLTGASPDLTGVTTNGFAGREPLPTLLDVVRAHGGRSVVVGPTELGALLGVGGEGVSLRPRDSGGLVAPALVDDAIRLSHETSPSLVVVDLPDLDGTARRSGAASPVYASTASKIDAQIERLVSGLQAPDTAFVVTSDHGLSASGRTGGAEADVARVPAIFAGSGIRLATGAANATDLAPTIAVLLGMPDPAWSEGQAIQDVLTTEDPAAFGSDGAHHIAFARQYLAVVQGVEPTVEDIFAAGGPGSAISRGRAERLAADRNARTTSAVVVVLLIAIGLAIIGVASWRAILASGIGALLCIALYDAPYFWLHGGRWSLTGIDASSVPVGFVASRLVESAIACLLGAAAAALVYGFLRTHPKGPRDPRYLAGWLTLGATTALVVLAVLGVQVAWYWWQWGFSARWGLPDLGWWVKNEVDLLQALGVGVAGLVAPLVSYLVGRYHPKVTTAAD